MQSMRILTARWPGLALGLSGFLLVELRVPPRPSLLLLPYSANVNLTAAYRRWPWEKLDISFWVQRDPKTVVAILLGQNVAPSSTLSYILLHPLQLLLLLILLFLPSLWWERERPHVVHRRQAWRSSYQWIQDCEIVENESRDRINMCCLEQSVGQAAGLCGKSIP